MVGSLIAGESALIAMSTRMRIAYLGSCSNVRSDPSRTSRRSRRSGTGRAPPWTRKSGMPSTTVSPTAHASATTAPSRAGEGDEAPHVDGLDHRGAAAVDEDLAHRRQLVGAGPAAPARLAPSGA